MLFCINFYSIRSQPSLNHFSKREERIFRRNCLVFEKSKDNFPTKNSGGNSFLPIESKTTYRAGRKEEKFSDFPLDNSYC